MILDLDKIRAEPLEPRMADRSRAVRVAVRLAFGRSVQKSAPRPLNREAKRRKPCEAILLRIFDRFFRSPKCCIYSTYEPSKLRVIHIACAKVIEDRAPIRRLVRWRFHRNMRRGVYGRVRDFERLR